MLTRGPSLRQTDLDSVFCLDSQYFVEQLRSGLIDLNAHAEALKDKAEVYGTYGTLDDWQERGRTAHELADAFAAAIAKAHKFQLRNVCTLSHTHSLVVAASPWLCVCLPALWLPHVIVVTEWTASCWACNWATRPRWRTCTVASRTT